MKSEFREKLLNSNSEFKSIFASLLKEGKINEFSNYLWDIIRRDRTAIRINREPLAFKDLFHQNLTEGRCRTCAYELVILLDKFGIYSEAVRCINTYLKRTEGSSYGGHYYVEAHFKDEVICIDTSLVVTGSEEAFKSLGHIILKKYDIDTLFKENPELIDYYDEMIINKTGI